MGEDAHATAGETPALHWGEMASPHAVRDADAMFSIGNLSGIRLTP
ncbi:MAG: hypothetical protein ACXVZX_16000 [Terriglobales bacterium]